MPRSRREKVAIGFMIVWLTFWAAGMLIVLWGLGGTLLGGELAPALFIGLWLAAAGFALWMGARRLRGLIQHGRLPRPPAHRPEWKDGVVDRRQP